MYLVDFGGNLFITGKALLKVKTDAGGTFEFFKLREIDRKRSDGAFATLDCKLKDRTGKNDVVIAKNRPVHTAENDRAVCECDSTRTRVTRANGELLLEITSVSIDDLASSFPGQAVQIRQYATADGLRIRGDFMAGSVRISATDSGITKYGPPTYATPMATITGCVKIAAGGIMVGSDSFAI
jgi:hypothetical protein